MKDTVAIYSGGMDSFTLVNELLELDRLHSCLSFDYGQRHKKELDYALKWTVSHNIPHCVISLGEVGHHYLKNSALTMDRAVSVPEGHYEEESMRLTVVPNRNAIMISITVAYAVSHNLDFVSFGAHGGDHAVYPDCRPEFVTAIDKVSRIANWHSVGVLAPYLQKDKAEIIGLGLMLGLDYADSWTCYKGEQMACGRCGSCQERLHAFHVLGIDDPLPYVTRELLPRKGTVHGG